MLLPVMSSQRTSSKYSCESLWNKSRSHMIPMIKSLRTTRSS
ncbi:hypothetical protein OESDEN_15179 [Oesophagostomum dentatum]|uniref:Uncharacterized protein n=1 Tax=Oesophagostomum dentatum TaxID=61180 RepID=A0A0B1SPK0_OESDE|nr:hypothetical protein OESDEN_15179 [Oesophagostomum dentatum]